MDAFVGREPELTRLGEHRERESHSVLTVTGLAGVGKTRLLREYIERAPEGWWTRFVSLVEVGDASAVLERFVVACGLRPVGRDDLDRACRRLSLLEEEGALLIFDNAEHVRAELATIVERVAELDFVQVVVTSREPLAIDAEEVLHLEPLGIEEGARLIQQVAEPLGVSVSDDDARSLSRALDGIPLAIRLAAERTTILSPKQIEGRVRESNRVLRRPNSDRHASLDLALGRSWAHLELDERQLCIGLATLGYQVPVDVAVALWPEFDVEALAERLVARSWLAISDRNGARCFQMLSAVRNYVQEQSPEIDQVDVRERLAKWAVGQPAEANVWWHCIPEGLLAVAYLRAEHQPGEAAHTLMRISTTGASGEDARAIVKAAIELVDELSARENGEAYREVCCRMSVLVARLYFGYFGEQDPLYWSQRAIAFAPNAVLQVRALAITAVSFVGIRRHDQGEHFGHQALQMLENEFVSATEVEPSIAVELASSALNLSIVFHAIGDYPRAHVAIGHAQKLFGPECSASYRARCLSHKAHVLFDEARFEACSKALRTAHELLEGAPVAELRRTFNVLPAYDAIARGDLEWAAEFLEEFEEDSERNGSFARLFYHDQAAAMLAVLRGESPMRHLHRAYYKYALLTGDMIANARGWFALILGEIWEGNLDVAQARIEQLLVAEDVRLPGDPETCRDLLRAAHRFARACQQQGEAGPIQAEESNAFEEVVDAALAAIAAQSPEAFSDFCAGFDLARITLHGVFMFRFEQQVESWVRAQLRRRHVAVLRIEREGLRFEVDGRVFDVSRKGTLRRTMLHLTRAALEQPGEFVSAESLVPSVWPSVKDIDVKALNRAYATINRLRHTTDAGLYLESGKRGYRFSQRLRIEWVDKLAE